MAVALARKQTKTPHTKEEPVVVDSKVESKTEKIAAAAVLPLKEPGPLKTSQLAVL